MVYYLLLLFLTSNCFTWYVNNQLKLSLSWNANVNKMQVSRQQNASFSSTKHGNLPFPRNRQSISVMYVLKLRVLRVTIIYAYIYQVLLFMFTKYYCLSLNSTILIKSCDMFETNFWVSMIPRDTFFFFLL